MDRRRVLKTLASLPLTPLATKLYAAPAAGARLLVVFMRGGYDAANLLVPISSNFYYDARPNIAIAKPGTAPDAALPLDADWGVHPAAAPLAALYARGELAFVPFAGTDDLTRSHFETQDAIELGQPGAAAHDFTSGFLDRLVGVLNGAHPIAFTDQLPVAFRGDLRVPNMALKFVGRPVIDERQSAAIAAMYRHTALADTVSEGFSVREGIDRELGTEMAAASRNAVSPKGFGIEAGRIARLMKDSFDVGFVDVGGWDTHVAQGGASGYLATRLQELAQGLAGFAEESGPAWRDTVVVVISEFGRTFRENGNRGTDHGHGSVYWLLGGGIRGGRIAGEQIRLEAASLFQDRDYPVLNEYRALFSGLFQRMYGLSAAQLERVFPGSRPKDLGLL